MAILTCTHVLLELVPHVHKLLKEWWPGKPLSPSSQRFYLTQVQCPLEPGGRQLPAVLLLVGRSQQFCQVPPPRYYGPCQPAWTPEREELEAEGLTTSISSDGSPKEQPKLLLRSEHPPALALLILRGRCKSLHLVCSALLTPPAGLGAPGASAAGGQGPLGPPHPGAGIDWGIHL